MGCEFCVYKYKQSVYREYVNMVLENKEIYGLSEEPDLNWIMNNTAASLNLYKLDPSSDVIPDDEYAECIYVASHNEYIRTALSDGNDRGFKKISTEEGLNNVKEILKTLIKNNINEFFINPASGKIQELMELFTVLTVDPPTEEEFIIFDFSY